MLEQAVIIIGAYILGCFNTGYYLVRLTTGADIRAMNSGGTGSRNVGRTLGAKGFLCTFAGDAGKGALAVWVASAIGSPAWVSMAVLIAVVAGHIFPLQLGFRGGKGFATFAGGLAVIAPPLLLIGFGLSLVFLSLLRRTTKSGLLALSFSPAIAGYWRVQAGASLLSAEFMLYLLLVVLVLYGHRDNIRKDFFGRTALAAAE